MSPFGLISGPVAVCCVTPEGFLRQTTFFRFRFLVQQYFLLTHTTRIKSFSENVDIMFNFVIINKRYGFRLNL